MPKLDNRDVNDVLWDGRVFSSLLKAIFCQLDDVTIMSSQQSFRFSLKNMLHFGNRPSKSEQRLSWLMKTLVRQIS